MSTLRQRDWCEVAYEEAGGDRDLFVKIYAQLDESGEAPRESNTVPLDSRAYARVMWHSGNRLGWFSADR